VLEVPGDRPRPRIRSYRGGRHPLRLPAESTARLMAVGERSLATLFSRLLAVFGALLKRWSGVGDLVIGSPVAGRTRTEVEPLIGLFINLLPLRLELGDDPSFLDLCRRVQRVVVAAQAHQELPFERLVEELQPSRELSHAPIVQVVFTLLVEGDRQLELPGLEAEQTEVFTGAVVDDLELSLQETAAGLAGRIDYNADLYDAATIDRLARGFERLVAAAAATPEAPLSRWPLLTPPEERQLLAAWAEGPEEEPEPATLAELLGAAARRGGDRPALLWGESSFSYRQLLASASAVAARLAAAGAGPETLVAIYCPRDPRLLAAVWGVALAGAAFLPLDPTHPEERLRYQLADSGARLAVADPELGRGLPEAVTAIELAPVAELAAAGEEPPAAPAADPASLAYVLYTSGSTGRPKGVMVEHRNAVNFLTSIRDTVGLTADDTLLAVTTLAFDISLLELLAPLLAGGRVALADAETAADGAALARALESSGATVMQATPAGWKMLLASGWEGDRRLRILCGGEALEPELARTLGARGGGLWNLYGPTETTVWSSAARLDGAVAGVPIGRPLARTGLRVLGPGMALQPVGVWGELHIGGAGVARGYLGRPALTAERFVADPFAGDPGARLYRTGDLARVRGDGELELRGRTDHQVKVRGFRIELGEIEAVLAEHPEVSSAVVLLRRDRRGEPLLVGYLVPRRPAAGEGRLEDELREQLERRLPPYMVPSALVTLDSLPLTPNGKVDRAALRRQAPAVPDFAGLAERSFTAPRTDLERRVAERWGEELGIERVGVETSFFDLGGHSLSATRLLHRLGAEHGVELSLPRFFEAPTVAAVAASIARRRAELAAEGREPTALPSILPDPEHRFEPFPLNDVQQAYWIGRAGHFTLGNVSSHNYFELDVEELDPDRFTRALGRVIERHDMLRAVVGDDGRQRILERVGEYRPALLDLCGEPPEEAEAALAEVRAEMSHQVLPADRWPLFEIRLSRLDERRWRLHVSLDFLIADAWSTGIVSREIFRFYDRPELELPPLELSFRDCVLAEAGWAESDRFRRAQEYWRERLADLPPAPELPLAVAPESLETPRFVRRTDRLPAADWQRFQERAAGCGLTPSGALLAVYAEVLAAWSKSPRFTVNVTLFNRPPLHPQIDEIVGDFTALSLLSVDHRDLGSFDLRARAAQDQLWSNLEHRIVSAVRILRELARVAGRDAQTVMPVVFTSALGQPSIDLEGGSLKVAADPVFGVSQTPQVWLDNQVVERRGELIFNWDAVEELFPAGMLDDMFAAYRRLLRTLSASDDWRRVEPPRPPENQLRRWVAANATAGPEPAALLHQLFEARVAERREEPAVIASDATLTYGELELRANHLAHELRRRGAAPDRLVAVVMEKGWQQVVAVLAVLKAGAAYLPIDPALPAKRVRHLLEFGEVELAVTQPWLASDLDWPASVVRLEVGEEPPGGTPPGGTPPPVPEPVQGLGELAYVIFTSGSTGQPKGVMIEHRGAVNTVLDVNERFGVGPEDRVLALSSLSFDLSVWDLFGPLAAGGAVVLPDAGAERDPGHWAARIAEHRVTVWNSVPALMELLLESRPAPEETASLRLVLLSGDWIPVRQPERIRRLASGVEVISLGGATEASIWSILHPIGEVDPEQPSIPYGKAMRNQSFHVLDHRLEPRPAWVPGELYIGGIGLARGYWRDPEKTAASFIVHPGSGERLYRTGDLGRYLPDGDIEFLGREDFQVKIRGHRIELGEIESVLQGLEEVNGAVVTAVVEDGTPQRLVAYVVPAESGGIDAVDPLPAAPTLSLAPESLAPESLAPASPAPADGAPALGSGDRVAHLEHKLAQPGIRRDLDDRPAIDLSPREVDEAGARPFRARRSHRRFRSEAVPASAFRELLSTLAEGEEGRRRYPSAAGSYPVEVLVHLRPGAVAELGAGSYRYRPAEDRLEPISSGGEIAADVFAEVNRPIFEQAGIAVFLVADGDRLVAEVGEGARPAALFEAGHLGQLLMEEAPAGGLGFCPIGTADFDRLRPLFGLDGSWVLLHTLLGGVPEEAVEVAGGEAGWSFAGATEHRDFVAEPLPADDFGGFLGRLRQLRLEGFPLPKYRYPSAGDLYPVQCYLVVAPGRVDGVAPGVYYYHPAGHRLSLLAPASECAPELFAAADRGSFEGCAFSLLLVSRRSAIAPVYGELADDFCALEAGYVGQLLRRPAPVGTAPDGAALTVGLAPLAIAEEARLRALLELEDDQAVLAGLAAGAVPAREEAAATATETAPAPEPAGVETGPGGAGDDPFAGMAEALGELGGGGAEETADRTPDLIARLRGQLEEHLPEYMVPADFVFLTRLPLTANGKVDRRSLPAPQGAGGDEGAAYQAPRSATERMLAEIWAEVLGRDKVGVGDNFFALGGTSLHMVQIHNQLKERLSRDLRITELFRHPTIAALAGALERERPEESRDVKEIENLAQKQKNALKRQRELARRRSRKDG
jgi:amino acid adenylation domain-containing protein